MSLKFCNLLLHWKFTKVKDRLFNFDTDLKHSSVVVNFQGLESIKYVVICEGDWDDLMPYKGDWEDVRGSKHGGCHCWS